MNLYFFYHANCFDGFGCHYYFRSYAESYRNTLFRSIDVIIDDLSFNEKEITEKLSSVQPGSKVIFADYCPKAEWLTYFANRGIRVLILDHHHTASQVCENVPEFKNTADNLSNMSFFLESLTLPLLTKVFDMKRSGTTIVYDFLHNHHTMRSGKRPLLADYLQDRDLWKFELPKSKEVNAYIQSAGFTYEEYQVLDLSLSNQKGAEEVAKYGALMLKEKDKTVWTITNNKVRKSVFHSLPVGIFNTTSHWSEVGEAVLTQNPDILVSIGVTYDFVTMTILFSFRSKGDIDCSPMAKAIGGGGHKNASGANCKWGHGVAVLAEMLSHKE